MHISVVIPSESSQKEEQYLESGLVEQLQVSWAHLLLSSDIVDPPHILVLDDWDAEVGGEDVQRLALNKFSAWRRLVSVNVAPLSMRATSRILSSSPI